MTAGFLFGTVLSAFGDFTAGRREQELHDLNARMFEMQAQQARKRGAEDVRRLRRQQNEIQGAQMAAAAASGFEVGRGDSLEIQADTARIIEEDISRVRENAILEVSGFRFRAHDQRRQGHMARASSYARISEGLLTAYGQAKATGMFQETPQQAESKRVASQARDTVAARNEAMASVHDASNEGRGFGHPFFTSGRNRRPIGLQAVGGSAP